MFVPSPFKRPLSRIQNVLLGRSTLSLVGLVLLSLFAVGCYESHPCSEEVCNYLDDDCDGRYDETFLDDEGRYVTAEHCGGCGVRCSEVFPTAAETACVIDEMDAPGCVIVACPEGFHLAGDGACVPDVPALCLPCTTDTDCQLRDPAARCLATTSGQPRCASPCGSLGECEPGFACQDSVCVPESGYCGCTEETYGAQFACLVDASASDHTCAGVQLCTPEGLTMCEPAIDEGCNDVDDDCDGEVDEDFRDDEGRYVARLHCGGCGIPCVEPGPNMLAECQPRAGLNVECVIDCEEGFVDVDGIAANGCECERFDGVGPPPSIGGDIDCDGAPDDDDLFIYVTTTGSDTNPGTLLDPMRTLDAAIMRGAMVGKNVLVARGVYDAEVNMLPGVSVFGGYRPDFRDRDLELFPVLLENRSDRPGSPVLRCQDIRTLTRLEGVEIQGSDATTDGTGSTAVVFNGCGPEVSLVDVQIVAGRAALGTRGFDSSDRVAELGIMSLEQLDGADGLGGDNARDGLCVSVAAGAGGAHSCGPRDVSGGDGGGGMCNRSGCTNGAACGNAGCTDYTFGGVCDFDAVLRDAAANPAAESGRGIAPGSAGPQTYNAPTNRGVCNFCDDNPTLQRNGGNGTDGLPGIDGTAGVGCMTSLNVDLSTGWVFGGNGTDGTGGVDGSGGGGGTAGAGYDVIGGTDGGPGSPCGDRAGGAGGGGGSGGCGAPGATAGLGGGSSVGVLVSVADPMTSGPRMEKVRIITASGGDGGDGGIGAEGGRAGQGAAGGAAEFWCSRRGGRGGDGGKGGGGGGGGGGCGGGSFGVVIHGGLSGGIDYEGAIREGAMIELVGAAGRGGRGGFSPVAPGSAGLDGSVADIFFAR